MDLFGTHHKMIYVLSKYFIRIKFIILFEFIISLDENIILR